MKFSFSVVVLILLTTNLMARQRTVICGHVKTDGKFNINIYEPVNGYYNLFYDDTTANNSALINGKDSIYREVSIDRPSFLCIRFTDGKGIFLNRIDVLLFPGDSLNLHFNLALGNPGWVQYSGANAAGQYLFNQINLVPYNKFIPVFNTFGRLPGNTKTFVSEINNCVSDIVNRFDTLKNKGQVSPEFVESVRLCFKALFYEQVIDKFTGNYEERQVVSKHYRDSIVRLLIMQMPDVKDKALSALYLSTIYIRTYYQYLAYKKNKLNSTAELYTGDKECVVNGKKLVLNSNLVPLATIEDEKMREDLWAMQVLDFIKFVPSFPSEPLIEQYCLAFPDNHWEKYLRNELKVYASGISKATYELQSPVVFIDTNKKIETFDNLVKELPQGTPMFVDIWASWCGPCADAFSANKSLDSLLLSKKISHVYISFDRQTDKPAWRNAINKYSLGGYHILADDDLIMDIKRVIHVSKTVGTPFFIPRYIIVNASGKIVENDANSPLNFDSLKDQIEKSLALNN